ncbi:homoserine O-succinyltransferase [Anaerofilum sp. An201]|nr:homoserine O-succinyltransferase [Anaerofilum sp. An201]OUP04132.1 homoserine O-succinyltransferase [Anaerofilum sp. An201]
MPLILPKNLPAAEALERENIFVMPEERARNQDIRPLRIVVVNLMPTKIATETQLARLLASTPLQVVLTFLRTGTHQSKNTSENHLQAFYRTVDEVMGERFDGMIITGAPVEQMPFEEVDYWPELCRIMDFSKKNVWSTLHVCWGAQAGLYHHFGIRKQPLDEKMFGIFPHRVTRPSSPLVRGFDEIFYAPHSRHTTVSREDVLATPQVRVLAESDEAGLYLMATDSGRQIFVTGHPEYDRLTLDSEYRRDLARGLAIQPPAHYYADDDPGKDVLFRWRGHAHLLYSNWLNYYVYQQTPYDLTDLPGGM